MKQMPTDFCIQVNDYKACAFCTTLTKKYKYMKHEILNLQPEKYEYFMIFVKFTSVKKKKNNSLSDGYGQKVRIKDRERRNRKCFNK